MNAQFRLALTCCCLLTGCNTSQPPPLNQPALAGSYVYRSVDTSVDKPTDHQFDRLVLKADGTYDLVQGGSTKARSEKTGEWNVPLSQIVVDEQAHLTLLCLDRVARMVQDYIRRIAGLDVKAK